MRKLMWFAIPVALVFVLGSTGSLEGQSFDLSVRNIMRGPDLVGRSPTAFRGGWASWSPDSRYVYFNWEQAGVDTVETIYRVAIGDNTVERFPDADADTIVAGNGVWTRDMRRAAYAISGDLFLWDEGEIRRLTKTDQRETSPAWSPDGETLFFQSNNDVFAWHLANGAIEQMTDIRSGNAPAET
ncbi:MAG: DPP IV N-terminal domain-containing protein, partial [Gemmatimonadota bacterium]|nr:DPP IV N-terminal domain-containing protein [Gemmatimonadota bacterium]